MGGTWGGGSVKQISPLCFASVGMAKVWGLGIAEEHHEAEIHVVLLVAVQKGLAGVVGGELHLDFFAGGDEDGVLDDAVGVDAFEAAEFEAVAMEVHGVVVLALVTKDETVTGAGVEDGGVRIGIGFAVDAPMFLAAVAGEFGVEDEREGDEAGVWGRSGGGGGEGEVAPDEVGGLLPLGWTGAAGVLDDDTHAGSLNVLAHFAEDPDAGVVAFDQGGYALGRGKAELRDSGGVGDWVAVEGDDLELMAGEGDPVGIRGAGVEDVEEKPLALPDADGIVVAEGAAVDGGDVVERLHGAVVATGEVAAPVVQGEEGFNVVAGRVVAGFDEKQAVLAGVLAELEIAAGEGVGVKPAKAGWGGREGVASGGAGGDHRRAFFHGAIDRRRKSKAVPVDDLGAGGLVDDVDGDGPAFGEAEKWARDLTVIGDRVEAAFGGHLKGVGGDREGVIGGS